jgi:hypothetical protein
MTDYEKLYVEESGQGKPKAKNYTDFRRYSIELNDWKEGFILWLCKRLEKVEGKHFEENLLLDKAITQMNVLNVVMSKGGMDIYDAIIQLNLVDIKYIRLARENNLKYIATKIEEFLKLWKKQE